MGAVLASEEVGNAFEPGDHAATFGGGPLACAAALASIQTIQDEGLLAQSRSRGECFKTQLKDLFQEYGMVEDVRGRGMMLGMEMGMPCASMVDEMRQQGVLVNCTAGNVLRFVPPLVITTEQINEVTDSLDEVLRRNSD